MSKTFEFLHALQPDGPWFLSAIDPTTGRIHNMQARTDRLAEDFIGRWNGKRNLYFSPNAPAGLKLEDNKRLMKQHITSGRWVFVDIDSTYKAGEIHQAVIDRLMAYEPKPSAVVFTGGGYQAFVHLNEDVPGADIERMNDTLIADLGGDPKVFTAEHLMRLPDTLNIPDKRKRERGRVETQTQLLYLQDNPVEPFEITLAPPRPPKVEVKIELGDVPEHVSLDALPIGDELRCLIHHGFDVEHSHGDDRSDYMFLAAAQLIRHGVPDELVASILGDPEYAISQYALDREDTERQINRAISNAYVHGAISAKEEFDADPLDDELIEVMWEEGKDAAVANQKKRDKRRARFKRLKRLDLDELEPPEWLVDGWITEFGLVQVIGVRKKGKTFAVLDMALHVCQGMPWRGHVVKRKRVTYVIAEGSTARFYQRIKAWCKLHNLPLSCLDDWFDVVNVRVGVDDIEELKDFIAADMSPVGLVIFDTVARNMNGDENATADMNRFVKGADLVRSIYGCAVLVVHHIGKEESKGGRGSTSLPGAVDATIFVGPKGKLIQVRLEECRDNESGETRLGELVKVPIVDKYGVIEDAAVLQEVDITEEEANSMTDAPEDRMLRVIAERGGVQSAEALVDNDIPGRSISTMKRLLAGLKKKRLVSQSSPYQLTPSGEKRLEELGVVLGDVDAAGAD